MCILGVQKCNAVVSSVIVNIETYDGNSLFSLISTSSNLIVCLPGSFKHRVLILTEIWLV